MRTSKHDRVTVGAFQMQHCVKSRRQPSYNDKIEEKSSKKKAKTADIPTLHTLQEDYTSKKKLLVETEGDV